jgi:hypothetical protein
VQQKSFAFRVVLAGLVCAGAALGGDRKPASVLIYPVHRTGPQFYTILSVTNTNTEPSTPVSIGGSTNAHFEYVNVIPGGDPFSPQDCVVFDRVEYLTPADTLSVLTLCHNATSVQGQRGYVVITAEDPTKFSTPWSHNWLIGSSLHLHASGSAFSTEAFSFTSPLVAGAPTDISPQNGKRDFNGNEYEQVPDVLYIETFIPTTTEALSILNLTGGPLDRNTLHFTVWNNNEYPMSTTRTFNCWFDTDLTAISFLFSEKFLRSTPFDPRELDLNCDGRGDVMSGWARIQSIGVKTPGGTSITNDGAFLGAMSSGFNCEFARGRLLWESKNTQANGCFFGR